MPTRNQLGVIVDMDESMFERLYACKYGYRIPAGEIQFQSFFSRKVRVTLNAQERHDKTFCSKRLEQGSVVLKIMEQLMRITRPVMIDESAHRQYLTEYRRIVKEHDSFTTFRSMVFFTDAQQVPFCPMEWTPQSCVRPWGHETVIHKNMSNTMSTLVQYARWLNMLEHFIDQLDTHLQDLTSILEIREISEDLLCDRTYAINTADREATLKLRKCTLCILCGQRTRAVNTLKEAKALMSDAFDKLTDAVADESCDVIGTNFTDDINGARVNSCQGEQFYLKFATQIKETSEYLETELVEGDKYGHFTLIHSYMDLKPLTMAVDPAMWNLANEFRNTNNTL